MKTYRSMIPEIYQRINVKNTVKYTFCNKCRKNNEVVTQPRVRQSLPERHRIHDQQHKDILRGGRGGEEQARRRDSIPGLRSRPGEYGSLYSYEGMATQARCAYMSLFDVTKTIKPHDAAEYMHMFSDTDQDMMPAQPMSVVPTIITCANADAPKHASPRRRWSES